MDAGLKKRMMIMEMEIEFVENAVQPGSPPIDIDIDVEKQKICDDPGAWVQTRLLTGTGDGQYGQASEQPRIYLRRAYVVAPPITGERAKSQMTGGDSYEDRQLDIIAHALLSEEWIEIDFCEFGNASDSGMGGGYIRTSTRSADYCQHENIKLNLFHFCRAAVDQYVIATLESAYRTQKPVSITVELLWRPDDYATIDGGISAAWNGELLSPGHCSFVEKILHIQPLSFFDNLEISIKKWLIPLSKKIRALKSARQRWLQFVGATSASESSGLVSSKRVVPVGTFLKKE